MTLIPSLKFQVVLAAMAVAGFALAACAEKPADPALNVEQAADAIKSDPNTPQKDAEDGHSHASGEKDAH
ncbi:hypothetical protein [Asticcacaulis sp. YBE204]|uniref:hypothetical protein n=1 Tax=Asticcacaulis sp. YBE204 TaxID=1282363 RepID=UPI0003C412CE|nr:hypothetical protein [Asticcacaulis sp. YBE204]ESQ79191.1 hypothetical protein AEYBE204_09280 [Asticcacaulis sp. YBE204]